MDDHRLPRHELAKEMRRAPTPDEYWLWQRLRGHRLMGHRFRRQRVIGPYVVDFVCLQQMLIVELHGGQHADQQVADAERTAFSKRQGYVVLRFWNNELSENRAGVLETIARALQARAAGWRAPRRDDELRGGMTSSVAG